MKKSRFLALIMVVAVMLMGAGFAYWNDTVTINATAASGELDLAFGGIRDISITGCCDLYHPRECSDVDMTVVNMAGDDPEVQTISMTGMYPGAFFWYRTSIENVGTVAAQWTGVEVNRVSGNSDLYKAIKWQLKYDVPGPVGYKEIEGRGLDNMEEEIAAWLAKPENKVLICNGHSLDFDSGWICFSIPCDVEANQNDLMNLETEFKMEFIFEQPCCVEAEEDLVVDNDAA